jgi:hypothetical protein
MIHYFGDSHTKGIGNDGAPDGVDYFHISYTKYLTKLLGIEETNYAFGGKNFMLNLKDLSLNLSTFKKGDIILFQTQFFCNSLLRYPNRDFVVSSGRFDSNEIYTNPRLGINEDDSITLLKWTTKFEERRSLYDLDILIEILRYLRTQGIKTYLLYWLRGYDIELPDNEMLLKFDGNPYVCDGAVPTITKETNGRWKDEHTTNEFNEELANKIYKQIFG